MGGNELALGGNELAEADISVVAGAEGTKAAAKEEEAGAATAAVAKELWFLKDAALQRGHGLLVFRRDGAAAAAACFGAARRSEPLVLQVCMCMGHVHVACARVFARACARAYSTCVACSARALCIHHVHCVHMEYALHVHTHCAHMPRTRTAALRDAATAARGRAQVLPAHLLAAGRTGGAARSGGGPCVVVVA